MPPKTNPKDATKKEVIVDGLNLTAMTDAALLDFEKTLNEKLAAAEAETAAVEMEVNMLRNAWKMCEDKGAALEMDNVMIRRELDIAREMIDPSQWPKETGQFDKGAIYNKIKDTLQKLDEGPDDIVGLSDNESITEEADNQFFLPKPELEEERFVADKKNITANRRLKHKKTKYDTKLNKLQQLPSENVQSENQEVASVLGEESLEIGTISTGSVTEKSAHSVVDRPNIVTEALSGMQMKRKPLDVEQKTIRHLALLKERQWNRNDPRYDDADECDPKNNADSDNEHIFDDFNPIFEEDVDDAIHYYQMRKWLEYDYETLVSEMRDKVNRRINAISYVWTKDVKNVLSAQLQSVETYNVNLRETVHHKIDDELDRTKRNENHLKLLLKGLEEVRIKMIRERYATNMSITKQQTEELNYLIQESYDKTINELKASSKFNFTLTQIFFMRSAENDISLVHELHAEQKRVEENVKFLKIEVENKKRELAKLEGPLEDGERVGKWMETTIAALNKDMKSKRDHERINLRMSKSVEKLENETTALAKANNEITNKLNQLQQNYDEITEFQSNYIQDNAFSRTLRKMTAANEEKIFNLRRRLRDDYEMKPHEIRAIENQVLSNVKRFKKKKSHNLLETAAFNELITQFDLRAREYQVSAYVGIDKLAIPYRKTTANIITTFNDKEKVVFPFHAAIKKL